MCGHHDKGFNITSKGRQLQLEFESDCSIEARGYSATYEFLTGSTEETTTHRGNEHEPNCLEHPCHSNGTCYNDGDGNKCACPTGFVPPQCSQRLDFTIRTENSTVDQSSDIILKCRVNHRHRMIVWSFNDFEVYTSSSVYKIDTNGDLTVRNAQSRNTGKYTCEVLASGTVIQHSIWLTVLQTEECGGSVLSKKRRRRRKRIASYHKILGLYSDPANITKIPWHAFLWSSRHNHTFCGGVILSKRWIVTAAHCITRHEHFDTNEVYVFAGTIDCRASDVSLMKIKSFRTYPGYGRNSNSYDHDIALIHLQESFKFTKSVLPICLPAPGKAVLLMKPGIKSVTSGCGLTENYTQSEILNYVKVPIQDATTCAKSNSIVKTSPGTAFCAGYEEQGLGDACKGDSGGGLVAREKTRWYLIGIVSYGEDCDKHGKYGFYTNVSNYYYWIKSVVDCGQKADKEPSDNFRIIGGKETHLGLLPWVAGLEDPAARNSNFDCAGVILGEYWVMTAAHCLVSQKTRNTKKSIIVAVGTIDDSSKTRTDHSQKYRIQKKKFFLLPNFTNNCGVQDLALIHLQENKGIKFNKFIQPICLPSGNAEYPGSECIISGWGKTESKSEKYAKTLRWATVNIADDNTCGRFQDTSPCKRNINLLCAGKNNTDTCSGDSGGGLICRSNGKQEVTGVISFGPKECGQALSFFTRVSSYVKWIRETIKTNAYSSEDWDF
ncbi:transmembrane protease serine 9-like [Gigantopelta aegis]|uniref:transmembrane protease serine 9-like n=1 Tax=Gigantopelta aegis TaxID=1735272 RepID=UPI001B888556|nr:transmembrane protease serine 9-like [Gigantopelta aegis]